MKPQLTEHTPATPPTTVLSFWEDKVASLFAVDRFKIQNKFNLRSVLPAMGIIDALSPTAADFSGISGQCFHASQL